MYDNQYNMYKYQANKTPKKNQFNKQIIIYNYYFNNCGCGIIDLGIQFYKYIIHNNLRIVMQIRKKSDPSQKKKKEVISFKIILLGDAGVGKTSILLRYIKNQFNINYSVTLGVEFASKTISIDQNINVKLQLWDTAGQQTFRSIVKNFYRGVAAVFFVYSIAKRESFENLLTWISDFQENNDQQIIYVLIGTQSDRVIERQVPKEQAEEFMRNHQIDLFFQTSSKDDSNINDAFQQTGKQLFLNRIKTQSLQSEEPSVYVENPEKIKSQLCCK